MTETPDPYRSPAEVGEDTQPTPRTSKTFLLVAAIGGALLIASIGLGFTRTSNRVEDFGEGRRPIDDYDWEIEGDVLSTETAASAAPLEP
ncbi:MAG: hypothetical protein AAFX06_12865 [Planctomycetota bacterium]